MSQLRSLAGPPPQSPGSNLGQYLVRRGEHSGAEIVFPNTLMFPS